MYDDGQPLYQEEDDQKELLKEFSSEGKSKGPQTDSFSEKLKRFWKRD